MSLALTLRPFCCHCNWSMWPPARNEPVTPLATSGCVRPAQLRAVASELSVPAHHHSAAVAPTTSAAAPMTVLPSVLSAPRLGLGGRFSGAGRKDGCAWGAGEGVGAVVLLIRKQIPG